MELGIVIIVAVVGFGLYKTLIATPDAHKQSPSVNIKSLVSEVKKQLVELDQDRQENEEIGLFSLNSFELELSFIVKTESGASIGSDFQLITVDASSKAEQQNIQKIKLKWDAIKQKEVVERGEDLNLTGIE